MQASLGIERLVYERWGGQPVHDEEVERLLSRVARSQGWTFQFGGQDSLVSYRVAHWHDRFGNSLGWLLLAGNIAAVSTAKPEFGLPPRFSLSSVGSLYDALSADGLLVLPDADWLLADLTAAEREELRCSPSGNGWEAYSVKYWKPHTRAEVLFNHWD